MILIIIVFKCIFYLFKCDIYDIHNLHVAVSVYSVLALSDW